MADEPAFLTVGTEVSAKFKGAFCEAKIKKVQKCVKCKVTFSNAPNSVIVINDEAIQGNNLMVGITIKAQNPDNLQYSDAKIMKIMDSSLYTVEFDDGDIRTLRRNLICLKGQKHFQESQTLDKLPLTNPESFSTPVVTKKSSSNSKNGATPSSEQRNSSGQNKNGQTSLAKSSGHSRSVYSNVYDPNYNKGNSNKMKNTSVTSSNKSSNSSDKVLKKVHQKSIQTSKLPSQTESSSKSKSNTPSSAIKKDTKSNNYKEQDSSSDSEHEHTPSSIQGAIEEKENTSGPSEDEEEEEETQEEKDHFVARLYKFMDDRGTPLNKLPSIGSTDLNLHKLFKTVTNMGYYNKVTNNDKWMEVCRAIGVFKLCDWPRSMVVKRVQASYKKYLLSFEDFSRKLGCLMFSTPPEPRPTPTHGGPGGGEGGNLTPSSSSGLGESANIPNYVPVGRSLIREKRYSSSSAKNASTTFSTTPTTPHVSHRRRSTTDKGNKNEGLTDMAKKQQEPSVLAGTSTPLHKTQSSITSYAPPKMSPQSLKRQSTFSLDSNILEAKQKVDPKSHTVKEVGPKLAKITSNPPLNLKSFDEVLSSPDLIHKIDSKFREKKSFGRSYSENMSQVKGNSKSDIKIEPKGSDVSEDKNIFTANVIVCERLREKTIKLVNENSPQKFDESELSKIKVEEEKTVDNTADTYLASPTITQKLDLDVEKIEKSDQEESQSIDKLGSGINRTSRRLEAKKRKALVGGKSTNSSLKELGIKKKHHLPATPTTPPSLVPPDNGDGGETIIPLDKMKSSLKEELETQNEVFDQNQPTDFKVSEVPLEIKGEEEYAMTDPLSSQILSPDSTNGKVEITDDQSLTTENHDASVSVSKTGAITIEPFTLKPPTLMLNTMKEPFKSVCPSQTPSPPIIPYPAVKSENCYNASSKQLELDHGSNHLTSERDEDESDDGLKNISRSTWGPSSTTIPLMGSAKSPPRSQSAEVIVCCHQPELTSSWWRSHTTTEKQMVEKMEEQSKPTMLDSQHLDLVKRKVITFAEIQTNFVCPYDFTSIDEELPLESRIAVTKTNINSLKKHYQRHKTRVAEIDKILKNIQKLEESGASPAEIKEYYTNVKDNINSDISSDSSTEN